MNVTNFQIKNNSAIKTIAVQFPLEKVQGLKLSVQSYTYKTLLDCEVGDWVLVKTGRKPVAVYVSEVHEAPTYDKSASYELAWAFQMVYTKRFKKLADYDEECVSAVDEALLGFDVPPPEAPHIS